MPSDRSPPQRRPASPLTKSSTMDSLSVPQPNRHHHSPRQVRPAGPLQIPSLPRFHPANFPSQHTSVTNTPSTGVNSPQPPVSPRTQQRQYSEAQKQLYVYQREMIASAARSKPANGPKPDSPRLVPLAGSPGPVTPLELEGDNYLVAGRAASGLDDASQREYMERVIRDEAMRRQGEMSPRRHTSVGGC